MAELPKSVREWGIGDVLLTGLTGGMYGLVKAGAPAAFDLRDHFAKKQMQNRLKFRQGAMGDIREQLENQIYEQRMAAGEAGAFDDSPIDIHQAMLNNPALQAQYASKIAAIPDMQGVGGSMLNNIYNNAAALRLAQTKRQGGYENLNQRLTALTGLSEKAAKAMQPYRGALSMYEKARSFVDNTGGDLSQMTGVQDQALIKFAQKQILATEAVMSDDIRGTLEASGFVPFLDKSLTWLTSKKGASLGVDSRKQILDMMTLMRNQTMSDLQAERGRFDVLSKAGQFEQEDVYQKRPWGGAIEYRGKLPKGAKPYKGKVVRD